MIRHKGSSGNCLDIVFFDLEFGQDNEPDMLLVCLRSLDTVKQCGQLDAYVALKRRETDGKCNHVVLLSDSTLTVVFLVIL